MAIGLTKPWGAAVEKNVRDFYETLSEKDRRRFAAVQARQLGYGGVRSMAEVLGCSRRTIERGLAELDELPHDPAVGQVRRPGAGRKKKSSPTRPWNSICSRCWRRVRQAIPTMPPSFSPIGLRQDFPSPWPRWARRFVPR